MKMLVGIMLMALVLAACGGDTSAETAPTGPRGTDEGVVIEIAAEGGFVPIEVSLMRVPRFTVFEDGSVVVPDGQQFGFPAPAVIGLLEGQLDEATFADLLTFVDDLGLADIDNLELNEGPNVADAATTVIRYFDSGGEHRIAIYALGFDLTGRDARSAIVASMIERVDLAVARGQMTPYEPEQYVVHALSTEGQDPQQLRDGGAWPFGLAPDEMSAEVVGAPCATVDGPAAAEIADALETADSMTVWTHEGTNYRILARPLLPHQDGC